MWTLAKGGQQSEKEIKRTVTGRGKAIGSLVGGRGKGAHMKRSLDKKGRPLMGGEE